MWRLLIFNRRDIRNPDSGGAEIYTHEIFKRLTDKYRITHFSACFRGAAHRETIDGICYVRRGNEITTHIHGFLLALREKRKYELIIDQFNGIGFMTFCFKNSVMLIHQLYGDFWNAKLGAIGSVFKSLELILLRFYKDKSAVTVSESTKSDLIANGFNGRKIAIVQNGLEQMDFPPKETFYPIVMYLGRLVKTKNPEQAIEAFFLAKQKVSELTMYVAGDGEERQRLESKYKGREGIEFFGYVSKELKYELLRKASTLIIPSIREGWGQVVMEANMAGTPVVGYNVEGIRDSVRDGETGFLVPRGDIAGLANKIVLLSKDKSLLAKFSLAAMNHAKKFSWDESAKVMKKAFMAINENGEILN